MYMIGGISKRIHMEALYPETWLSNGTNFATVHVTAVSCIRHLRQLNFSSSINERGEKHMNNKYMDNKSFVFTDASHYI